VPNAQTPHLQVTVTNRACSPHSSSHPDRLADSSWIKLTHKSHSCSAAISHTWSQSVESSNGMTPNPNQTAVRLVHWADKEKNPGKLELANKIQGRI